MKILATAICVAVLISLSILSVSAQETWTIYECNTMPQTAVPAFTETIESDSATVNIINDSAIPGNKLLEFASPGDGKYRFMFGWATDPVQGATVVFRAKGLDPAKYKRAFEIQYANGLVREKFIGISDDTVLLETAKVTVSQNTAEWHIYRLVVTQEGEGIATTVYIDEKTIPLIEKTISTTTKDSRKFLQFGDASGNSDYGSLFDWFIWTTKGAFSPEQMPLPKSLTGLSKTK